jgi:hypothetical protein
MFSKKLYKEKVLFLAGFILLLNPCPLTAVQTRLANGDRISWDGQYYDFRDSAGIKMIKVWIPPGVRPVRGIFISGHGGGGGDSRNFARDENIRAFAMRLGFAVAGLHNFPGRSVYDQGAAVFFRAMKAFAGMGHHPELANLPFIMYGSSNGGAATYGFVNYAPERAICFVSNVGAGFNPEIPVEKALQVPGIFIVGQFDALIGQRGIDRTKELVAAARKKGALWAWALELKGHEDGFSFDAYMKLVEQSVKLRYPNGGDPLKGLLKLREIREEDGWLVDMQSWDSGLTNISRYADYQGDRSAAGWVLNEDMAFVYRSLATHFNPVRLSVREFDRSINLNTDPGTMFSLGGPVVNPGDRITVMLDAERIPGWKKISLFDGARKLGEVETGNEPGITFATSPSAEVYCLTAMATCDKGLQHASDPMHFFVNDPALSWNTVLPKTVFQGVKTNAGSKNAGREIISTPADPEDSILVAYGLTRELESLFSSADNALSPFWSLIGDDSDRMVLTQRKNGAPGSSFNFVLTHDCNMTVKAAYGADGIYLLMEINDDNDVAWPNHFAGTEKEQFYLNFDAVDLLLDSRSVAQISDPLNSGLLVSRNFGLTTTTRQYQVACGIRENRPAGFKRALSDPWDFHDTYYTFAEAKAIFGIQIENITLAPFYKAQEWFIPWSEVGGGLSGEPGPGARLAFTAGFNDRDEGEHFPPGVTSSGGTLNASNALRWIKKSDPWGSGTPPYNWGEIEIGTMLSSVP